MNVKPATAAPACPSHRPLPRLGIGHLHNAMERTVSRRGSSSIVTRLTSQAVTGTHSPGVQVHLHPTCNATHAQRGASKGFKKLLRTLAGAASCVYLLQSKWCSQPRSPLCRHETVIMYGPVPPITIQYLFVDSIETRRATSNAAVK
jgi:hypothetical protein